MDKFHGKLIHYSKTAEFLSSLPERDDFINKVLARSFDARIKDGSAMLFMPNDVLEQHFKENGHLVYKLILIGILRNGVKAAVVLDGIEPFYDSKVPDGISVADFTNKIIATLLEKKIIYNESYVRTEHIKRFPNKYFQEAESDYVRFYFRTLHSRNKALKEIVENEFVYYDNKNKKREVKLQTASDDLSCYYRKVTREQKFRLCSWNRIRNYTIDETERYTKKECVKYTFVLNVKDFQDIKKIEKPIDIQADPKRYGDLLKDKSMVAVWDLETDAARPTGNAPEVNKVFDNEGRTDDVIRMNSISFYWYYEKKPLVTINFTDLIVPPIDDCLTVICEDQTEILKSMALIMGRMAPEFVSGFNDGMYDWPFLLRRAEVYDAVKGTDLMNFMKKRMSVIPWTPENIQYTIKGPHKEQRIKVEAETYIENEHFKVPGFICIDVRTIFRQLYPTAEQSSLNFFLAANKLGSKNDMPYQTMFKIFRLMRHLSFLFQTKDYKEIFAKINDIRIAYGDEFKMFQHINDPEFLQKLNLPDPYSDQMEHIKGFTENPFRRIDNSPYRVNWLNMGDIYILMEQAKDVAIYCNVDAKLCQSLLNMRSIVADRREVSDIAYTSMHDALYRAGGMKVRNLVISEGIEPQWNMAFSNISNKVKDKRKYPGAHVVSPKKGCYRDHIFIKRMRRASFREALRKKQMKEEKKNKYDLPEKYSLSKSSKDKDISNIFIIDKAEITPGHEAFNEELASQEFNRKYPLSKDEQNNNDTKDESDRPCAGLDFSSLYPSLMMAYNLSPEKVIVDQIFKEFLEKKLDKYGKPYKFLEIDFLYGLQDQADDEKERIFGWMVQHHPIEIVDPKTGKKTLVDFQGMGLYPTILKGLFDKRSSLKKRMEYFQNAKEFLEFAFGKQKLEILGAKTLDEQRLFIEECITKERAKRQEDYDTFKKNYYKYKLFKINDVDKFFEKEWFTGPSSSSSVTSNVKDLYEDVVFNFNYFNSKQNAAKIFMNTFYGEAGNSQSAFFLPHVAGGTTTYGQKNIKLVKKFVEAKKCSVKYGDSVTGDTPIFCKSADGTVKYKRIDELATHWEEVDYGFASDGSKITKKHADTDEPLMVWSDHGWLPIMKVISHLTNKKIYRVETESGFVDVTEDHSLLTPSGEKVTPNQIKIGDPLLHSVPVLPSQHRLAISEKEAWLWGLFLAHGSIKEGQWTLRANFGATLRRARRYLGYNLNNCKIKMVSRSYYKLYIKDEATNKYLVEKYKHYFYQNGYRVVPEIIFNAYKSVQYQFLTGYSEELSILGSNIAAAGIFRLFQLVGEESHIHCFKQNDKEKYSVLAGVDRESFKKDKSKIKRITLIDEKEQVVYDLNTGNDHFAAGVGNIIVKNTDSIYPSPPQEYFADLDQQYETGVIDKMQYWTQMIEMTMEYLDKLSDEVGEMLYQDNGTRFLKMAYEEVLWPYAFVGKKKYIGVQHKGIVNLSICMPNCTLAEFIKSESLFIRGLEIKKRGASEFMKICCYEVWKEAFCIESTMTLKEISENKLKEIATRQWSSELFTKSARYRLPGIDPNTGEPKRGNVTVINFQKRMAKIQQEHPELGIQAPELGERFKYIVARKYPWVEDIRGRKKKTDVGNKYEYFESMKNEAYQKLLNEKVEIDLDYYITGEVIGQFSRFIIYHPEYDKFFEPWMYEDDTAYKKADKSAREYARKKLQKYYNTNFASIYVPKNKLHKSIFDKTNSLLSDKLEEKYGSAATLFDVTNKLIYGSDLSSNQKIKKKRNPDDDDEFDEDEIISFTDVHMKKKVRDEILELARTIGINEASSHIRHLVRKEKASPFILYKHYISKPNSFNKLRIKSAREDLATLRKEIDGALPDFLNICAKNNIILTDLIKQTKIDNALDNQFNNPIGIGEGCELPEMPEIKINYNSIETILKEKLFHIKEGAENDDLDEDLEIDFVESEDEKKVNHLFEIFNKIAARHKTIADAEMIAHDIEYYKGKKTGQTLLPGSMTGKVAKKQLADEFSDWLKKKQSTSTNTDMF